MKTFKTLFLILSWSFLTIFSAYCQDLSQFVPIAHYTLINTSADSLGNYDTIQLKNAPYQGLDGVYSNGKYPGTDTSGSTIRTPNIDGFVIQNLRSVLSLKETLDSKINR